MGARSIAASGGFEALCSEAITENGRLLEPVDPRDEGRCCHERAPARDEGIAAFEDEVESIWGFGCGWGSSRGKVSDPLLMILVGAPFALQGISCGPEGPDGGRWVDAVLEMFS